MDELRFAVADDHDACPRDLPGWGEVENQGLAGNGGILRFGLRNPYTW